MHISLEQQPCPEVHGLVTAEHWDLRLPGPAAAPAIQHTEQHTREATASAPAGGARIGVAARRGLVQRGRHVAQQLRISLLGAGSFESLTWICGDKRKSRLSLCDQQLSPGDRQLRAWRINWGLRRGGLKQGIEDGQ